MHKKTILILVIAVVAVFLLLAGLIRANGPIVVTPLTTTSSFVTSTTTPDAASTAIVLQPASTPPPATPSVTQDSTASTPTPNVSFSAGEKLYTVFAPAGSSVLDAMRSLASSSSFTFTGRDYPSLGFFVDSINGVSQANGYVWILYVNGEKSSLGASTVTVAQNDVIEWKYEKSY